MWQATTVTRTHGNVTGDTFYPFKTVLECRNSCCLCPATDHWLYSRGHSFRVVNIFTFYIFNEIIHITYVLYTTIYHCMLILKISINLYIILPYNKIVQMSKLNFMHAVRYRYSPHTFQSYWQINENRNMECELRNAADYSLPAPRTEFFLKQPIYSFPLIWNSFNDMKLQPNKITFQKYVKDYLLFKPAEELV